MDVTVTTLDRFRDSLLERGLTEGTADLYVLLVRKCSEHQKGITARLAERKLAPKTLRTNRAALMAWATFYEDGTLVARLKKIRLPPALRANPKEEFPQGEWKKLVQAIRTDPELGPPMRAVLILIAVRGLRCGDALRLRRREVTEAIRTGRLSFEAKGQRRLEYDARPIKGALELLAAVKGSWDQVEDLVVSRRCAAAGARRRKMAAQAVRRALVGVAERSLKADGAKDLRVRGVHPHRFRRTQAMAFLGRLKGDPQAIPKVMAYMGWQSMATALQYVDATQREELDQIGQDLAKELE